MDARFAVRQARNTAAAQPLPCPTANVIATRRADFSTLIDGLEYAAGGVTGLTFYDRRARPVSTLAYRALRDSAVILAQKLMKLGLEPGDRVGLIAMTDAGFIRAFFACQYAGLVPAPLPLPVAFGSHRHYVAMVRRMLDSIGARAVFSSGTMEDFARQAALGTKIRIAGSLTNLDQIESGTAPLPDIAPDQVSYLQFSSGSTRSPTAVTITHRALMANAVAIIRDGLQIDAGDRAVSWLPLYHDMGLVGFVLMPVLCQVSVDLIATSDFAQRPLLWLRVLSDRGGTLSYSPSFGYELCAKRLAAAPAESFDLTPWRVAGIGGDMIRERVLESFAQSFSTHGFDGRAFVASYGLAETTLAVSFGALGRGIEIERVDMDRLERDGVADAPRLPRSRARNFAICGTPLPGHAVEIRDESGQRAALRHVGRIFVRGPSVMREYWNREEETVAALQPDGWLDTGDLGFWAEGRLVVTGRAKDLIVINGRNLLPQDLEWSAEQQSGLRSGDAAAFSIDRNDREDVILLVQCRLTENDQRERLREAVRAAIYARHGINAEIVLVPPRSLPKTSSGKLSRSRARALYLSGELDERRQVDAELRCAAP